MSKLEEKEWSDETISKLEKYVESLISRIPILEEKLKLECAYHGTDVKIELQNEDKIYYLLIEIEQYASGASLEGKVNNWAKRHFENNNTTTIIISLVLKALRNRLLNEFTNESVQKMVFSPNFRIFPGSGDGTIPDELKNFIVYWVNESL